MLASLRKAGRPKQRHLRSATWSFTLNGSRPEVGNGRRPVRVLRVELCQFLFRFLLDPGAPLAHLVGQPLAVLRDVFEDDLVEQDGNRVEVAGEGIGPHAQGLQRNRSASSKGIYDQRPRAGRTAQGLVRGLSEGAAGVQVFLDLGVVPVGEVCDEVEQRMAQFGGIVEPARIFLDGHEPRKALGARQAQVVPRPVQHGLARCLTERRRAMLVGRVWPQRRADDRPARRQRPSRPPDVQRGDVPVTDAFLAPRVGGDALDGQVDLDEAFGIGHACHVWKTPRNSSMTLRNESSAATARLKSIAATTSSANSMPPRLGVTPDARMASMSIFL
ncbi:hypothetical protein Tfont_02610 [Tepidimonas fonticaldi]|uniref:Uncharacterized protein n=1 Tax=Tepidimonas fonticaldi TaxID=1101373 RepID=A0A554XFH4_9BURK|nr:hypothetical protein Tfont_02610 [Tepidimonas fonticaldi]